MELACTSEAVPAASVIWYRAGSGQIVGRRDRLELVSVTRDQAGEYVCRANNTVGTSQPATVDIAVQCEYFEFI